MPTNASNEIIQNMKGARVWSQLEKDAIILAYANIGNYSAVARQLGGINAKQVKKITNTDEAKQKIIEARQGVYDVVTSNFFEQLSTLNNGLEMGITKMVEVMQDNRDNTRGDRRVKLGEIATATKVLADVMFRMGEITDRKYDQTLARRKLAIEERRLTMAEFEYNKRKEEYESGTAKEWKGIEIVVKKSSRDVSHLDAGGTGLEEVNTPIVTVTVDGEPNGY